MSGKGAYGKLPEMIMRSTLFTLCERRCEKRKKLKRTYFGRGIRQTVQGGALAR
jgi:hypothetical protein